MQRILLAAGAEFAILPPQNASGKLVKVAQRSPVRFKLIPAPETPVLCAGLMATAPVVTGQKSALSDVLGSIQKVAKLLK